MKKLSIMLLLFLTSCQKEDWITPIEIGTKFNYKYLKEFTEPDGTIATNPFTVDSIAPKYKFGYDYYWISANNGRIKSRMDPNMIRRGIKDYKKNN